jgi:hypothetical protein
MKKTVSIITGLIPPLKGVAAVIAAGGMFVALFFIPAYANRPAIYSTTVDWEGVTGLRLRQYSVQYFRGATIGNTGWELYFLDQFPCTGQPESTRVWISPSKIHAQDTNARQTINCLHAPETFTYAMRIAKQGEAQGKTTNVLTCRPEVVGTTIKVNLDECVIGKKWTELR